MCIRDRNYTDAKMRITQNQTEEDCFIFWNDDPIAVSYTHLFFVIIYISNRYNIQHDIIELDKLQKELQDTKYKALSTSSQITEKSRESNVLDMLDVYKRQVREAS